MNEGVAQWPSGAQEGSAIRENYRSGRLRKAFDDDEKKKKLLKRAEDHSQQFWVTGSHTYEWEVALWPCGTQEDNGIRENYRSGSLREAFNDDEEKEVFLRHSTHFVHPQIKWSSSYRFMDTAWRKKEKAEYGDD